MHTANNTDERVAIVLKGAILVAHDRLERVGWPTQRSSDCELCDLTIVARDDHSRMLVLNSEEHEYIGFRVVPDSAGKGTIYGCKMHCFISILYRKLINNEEVIAVMKAIYDKDQTKYEDWAEYFNKSAAGE